MQEEQQHITATKKQTNMADIETGSTLSASHGTVAKGHKIGPITLPAYKSPLAQTIIIGFVCFLVVGKPSPPPPGHSWFSLWPWEKTNN